MVEDVSPVFSPDGKWIAFARRYLDPLRWTPGRQVWLMRADGTEAVQGHAEGDSLRGIHPQVHRRGAGLRLQQSGCPAGGRRGVRREPKG